MLRKTVPRAYFPPVDTPQTSSPPIEVHSPKFLLPVGSSSPNPGFFAASESILIVQLSLLWRESISFSYHEFSLLNIDKYLYLREPFIFWIFGQ